jgi:hypothetical protein
VLASSWWLPTRSASVLISKSNAPKRSLRRRYSSSTPINDTINRASQRSVQPEIHHILHLHTRHLRGRDRMVQLDLTVEVTLHP